MSSPDRLKCQLAGNRAEKLVEEWGITQLPVDPFDIAKRHDILVQPKPEPTPGVSGFLMRQGNAFGIMYATHIRNDGFIRFTVAHELGHYFLDGHQELLFSNGQTAHASRSGFISDEPHELEADHFAAHLLAPGKLFAQAMRKAGEGFVAIEKLAQTCGTSITATAIRFATAAPDPVVVIVSSDKQVEYCFVSQVLADIRGLRRMRKGNSIPNGTRTEKFNRDPENIRAGRREEASSGLTMWLEGAPDLDMNEDVVGLGSYGKTLTVLFKNEAISDDGDDD